MSFSAAVRCPAAGLSLADLHSSGYYRPVAIGHDRRDHCFFTPPCQTQSLQPLLPHLAIL